MWRASLLRLSSREHSLVVTIHHIASDGWSAKIFVEDLTACYRTRCDDLVSNLETLRIQYADYAIWQRDQLTQGLKPDLQYWRQQLQGLTPLELPSDRPRPSVPTAAGAISEFLIPGDLAARLHQLARETDSTPFMMFMTMFQTLLYRYTGQSDIAVGTPIGQRSRVEFEKLIGFFVNTVVIRTPVSAADSTNTLLARTRETCLAAYLHQELPFEKLVEEGRPTP